MIDLFVPGRLCLLGEHSDWAGARGGHPGECLAIGTDQGIAARARRAERLIARSHLGNQPDLDVAWDAASLTEVAEGGGFWRHVAGTARELVDLAGGLELDVVGMDLPLGKGLSSSAAIAVVTARALGGVWDLDLGIDREMEVAFRGERRTGSRCGRLDQVCALGQVATRLEFAGDRVDIESVDVGAPIHLLVVDLCGRKDTARILADLNAAWDAGAAAVTDALGPRNAELVAAGRRALVAGDARGLGEVMVAAQAVFDRQLAPACPAELTAPRLHDLLAWPAIEALTWGGKGVGSGGDGTAQLVCRDAAARDEAARLLAERGMPTFPVTPGLRS